MALFSEPLILFTALLCGMASRAIGFPALIGYLAAGFVLHELNLEVGPILLALADIGITLLLFTIGLKLEPRKLLATQVWGSTLIHMLVTQLAMFLILLGVAKALPGLELTVSSVALIAFALTFSSTVFVIQTTQERGELQSDYAVLAIGILIIQDLVAVGFLALSAGKTPHWYVLGILLIIPLRPLILRLLTIAGYGELLTLSGLAIAIGSAQLADAVGLKGDLGALIVGAMLAGHPKTKALAHNLIQLKDLFLVGFFLSIGLGGWPSIELIGVAVLLGLLAAAKPLLYFPLMTRFHTTPRDRGARVGGAGQSQRIWSYRYFGRGWAGLGSCRLDWCPIHCHCRQLRGRIPHQPLHSRVLPSPPSAIIKNGGRGSWWKVMNPPIRPR